MCVCVCAGARARVYVYSLYIQLKLSNLLPLICAPPYRRYRLLKDCMWHMYHFNFARLRLNCAQAVFRNWLKYHLKVAVRYRFTNTSTAFFSFTLLPRAIFRTWKENVTNKNWLKFICCVLLNIDWYYKFNASPQSPYIFHFIFAQMLQCDPFQFSHSKACCHVLSGEKYLTNRQNNTMLYLHFMKYSIYCLSVKSKLKNVIPI